MLVIYIGQSSVVNVEGTREEFKRPFDVNMINMMLGGIIHTFYIY